MSVEREYRKRRDEWYCEALDSLITMLKSHSFSEEEADDFMSKLMSMVDIKIEQETEEELYYG